MYGSYGSYSSLNTPSIPMDIASSGRFRSQHQPCAFPSWPLRSSLSKSQRDFNGYDGSEPRATSFLSDDDLCFSFSDSSSTADSDDGHSITGSTTSSVAVSSLRMFGSSPKQSTQLTRMETTDLLETQRERLAAQRKMVNIAMAEKEKRRQAQKQRRVSVASSTAMRRSSSNKSNKSTTSMAPIAENTE